MQSLSVSNLQLFELEANGYTSGAENQKSFKKFIKTSVDNENNSYRNKFNLKLNFGKLLAKNNQKYNVNLNDSGYLSGSTSAETIFSIDNNNYISFKHNPELRRELYSSSQSLYDKSPIDLSDIFGLNFKTITDLKAINTLSQNNKYLKSHTLQTKTNQKNTKEVQNNFQKVKYQNRSWDQILKLSDVALDGWLSSQKNLNNSPVNIALNPKKSFEFFEPNIEVKNSLLLNQNILYQPIRRYTSEINLRLALNKSEMFFDDFQLDSHLISEINLRETSTKFSLDQSLQESLDESVIQNNYTEEIYDLFMDLHEFRINDDNIEKVAENICKIDRYLLSRIKPDDLAGYLFNKSLCGCGLSSLCSVIQFGQALAKIVINCIDSKIAAYQRIAYIIAFIKLSMSLYQKSNWQSLNTLVSALHSINIYRMESEWIQIKCNHKHYFEEFLKLSAIVRSCETSLMYTIPKGIPSIKTLLLTQTIRCVYKWDRIEHPSKWNKHPGIIDWLEKELKYSFKTILHLKENQRNHEIDDNLSGCLSKQFICLIPLNKLPPNWLNRSVRNIPQQYKHQVLQHMTQSLKNELKF